MTNPTPDQTQKTATASPQWGSEKSCSTCRNRFDSGKCWRLGRNVADDFFCGYYEAKDGGHD